MAGLQKGKLPEIHHKIDAMIDGTIAAWIYTKI
jgi:hypothetical protein